MPRSSNQVRSEITTLMVNAINDDLPPWRKPWTKSPNFGHPCNFDSKRSYTGINPLILLLNGHYHNVQSKHWGTASSWMSKIGAQVARGSKGTHVVYYNMVPKKEDGKVVKNEQGETVMIPLMREFCLFNADQMQAPDPSVILDGRCNAGRSSIVKSLLGLKDRKERKKKTTRDELDRIAKKHSVKDTECNMAKLAERISVAIAAKLRKYQVDLSGASRHDDPDFGSAEALMVATGATINIKGGKAFYRPVEDFIQVPPKGSFESIAEFYETVFHELAHWARNGRVPDLYEKRQHTYAFEELVAEIAACFMLMEIGVPMSDTTLTSSRSYVATWVKGMGNDPKFIFDAATQASRVSDYLLSFVEKKNVRGAA